MKRQQRIALALALVMLFALGASVVSADDEAAETTAASETGESGTTAAATEAEAEEAAPVPDAAGTLSFGNLRTQMLEHYYPLLALEENIKTLEEFDYKQHEQYLRDQLNNIADEQWSSTTSSSSSAAAAAVTAATSAAKAAAAVGVLADDATKAAMVAVLQANADTLALTNESLKASAATGAALGSMASQQLQMQYDAYKEAYDAVRKGELQEDNEGIERQLRDLQDQTVLFGESLYITLKGLEAQDEALTRTIAGLKRTQQEMELRQELGQIPELTVQQVRAGVAQAESGQQTLRMNMENLRLQIKMMTGVALEASLTLNALPTVTDQQLSAMALDADLAKAQAASYELYDAKKTYNDAKDEYNDAVKKYGTSSKKNEFVAAKHTWQAAQYTYENAQLSYELKFRTLYAQVKDCAQTLETARTVLESQEKSYAVSALKYEQGSLSANALAEAKDALAEAKDSVASAERDLFSSYRSYHWAVEYGILNT